MLSTVVLPPPDLRSIRFMYLMHILVTSFFPTFLHVTGFLKEQHPRLKDDSSQHSSVMVL